MRSTDLIDNGDGTLSIPLTMGKFALVDSCDRNLVEAYTWQADYRPKRLGQFYARGWVNGKTVKLHRYLLGADKGAQVDHINANGLDNRRCNLRIASQSQNMANRRKIKCKSSPYKGVTWDAVKSLWRARIRVNKKLIHLGRFKEPLLAALAYNKAAMEFFGPFAKVNSV